jgi:hypothetical protein
MQIARMPERSLSVEMSRDRARLFVLSGGVLGVLLVVMLIVLLSPVHTLLSFGQTAPAHVPTATPTPAERTLFAEPLTSTSDRNWPNNDQCSQRADGYHISANVLCILNRYTPPPDVNISVDVRQVAGLADVSYGIGFHRASKNNFYTFEIDSSGRWYFYKDENSLFKLLSGSTTNRAIHRGLNVTNSLMVRITGSHYAFFVNGQLVGSADDSALGSGQAGLDGNDQIELVYTNFKVTKTVG